MEREGRYYSNEDFIKDIEILANKVFESGIDYKHCFIVARGGIVPAGWICQKLSLKDISIVSGYFESEVFCFRMLPMKGVSGRALMVSDLVKTGRTLENLTNKILEINPQVEIDIASLHYFPNIARIKPLYFVHKCEADIHIQYPWEI